MATRSPARRRLILAGSALAAIVAVGCSAAVAANGGSNGSTTATDPAPASVSASAAPASAAPSSSAASSSAAPSASTTSGTATPDILDVTFDSGAPVDHAQGLPATTVGAPVIADDPTLGTKAATFNGTSDAYLFPFVDQWPKMLNGFSYECVFRYDAASFTTAQQAVCSDTNSGGADMLIESGQLAFYVGAPSPYTVAKDPNTLIPGRWYIAVGAWDGTTDSLYVDGDLVASAPAAGPLALPDTKAQNIVLGADATDSGAQLYSPVTMAAARVFSFGLTAAQAQADAEAANLFQAPPAITATDVTARAGSSATFTATLSDKDMTGLVSFQYDGIDILCQAVASEGTATCHASKLPAPGKYDVEVRYSGDLNYGPMSTDLTLTVRPRSGHQA